jgi:hypothetical protein
VREVHLERLPSRPKDAKVLLGHSTSRVFYKAHATSLAEHGSENTQEPGKMSAAVQPKKACKLALADKQNQPHEAGNCGAGILRKSISEEKATSNHGKQSEQRLTGAGAIRNVTSWKFNKTLGRDSFYRNVMCAAVLADRRVLLGGT